MTITTQYIDATRKVQQSWLAAFEAVTTQFVKSLDRPVALPTVPADPAKVVDETFDFLEKGLAVQRETAHRVLAANAEFASQWRAQAEQFQGTMRQQAKIVTDISRDQYETFSSTVREQAQAFGETVEKQARTAVVATRKGADIAGDTAEKVARTAADATRKGADLAGDTAEKVADTTAKAATETAKRNYNLMNQAQLKGELAARKLAGTGTLDEMRARLRESDNA